MAKCDRCEAKATTTLPHIVVRDGKGADRRAFAACAACERALTVRRSGHRFSDEVATVRAFRLRRGGVPLF